MAAPSLKTLAKATRALPTEEKKFVSELSSLLNRYSKENASGTPDFILANYLLWCLEGFNVTLAYREDWHGRTIGLGVAVGEPGKRTAVRRKKKRSR